MPDPMFSHGTGTAPRPSTENNSPAIMMPISNGDSQPKSGSLSTGKNGVHKPKNQATKANIQESRRRYRERVKNKANETKERYAKVAEEIARLKLEQEHLQCENTVLESLCKYSESAVNLIRNAAESISTLATGSAWQLKGAAEAKMMAAYGDLVDTVWSKFLRPTDEQLRAMFADGAVKIKSVDKDSFLDRLCNAIAQWQTSSPAGREVLERKISYAFETRGRIAKILSREQPAMVESIFRYSNTQTASTQVKSRGARHKILENEDLIAATVLTEEQRIALLRHWKVYVAHAKNSRGCIEESAATVEESLTAIQTGALSSHEPVGSLSQVARSHLSLRKASNSLEELSNGELIARVNLSIGCIAVLRPLQQAYIMISSLPNADIGRDIVSVYRSLLRLEGADFALKHDYELPGSACARDAAAALAVEGGPLSLE
ncbi:hypothetical protein Ndes2526B_g01560 [Nannochloris sp. 'desiccata']|nr:hypothetical protein KSW81_005932 [Chlorella desiccata (nom. nud.)]KAH7623145.1 hypothetical protein NADE_002339 [Chlorella desiccata (nom. nud.)]